jgi:sarcosine oxidase subunit gamma
MLEHRAAFGFDDERSDPLLQHPDLEVHAVRDPGLLLLRSASVEVLQKGVDEVLQLSLPGAQRTTVGRDCALLWLAPTEWLLVLPRGKADSIEPALTQRVGSSLAVVTNVSDGFACFEASGSKAAELLMSGCSLDLAPHSFPAGCVVRTALAEVPAILWNCADPDRIRGFIDRAFSAHLLAWLASANVP